MPFITNNGYGQIRNPLLEVQTAFLDGTLTADEAVLAQLDLLEDHTLEASDHIKCATPLMMFTHEFEEELSNSTKLILEQQFSGFITSSAESYISPSGKFIFQYETTGASAVPLEDANNNSIPDYVEWAAEAADSSYRHEILRLGFKDPIPDGARYSIIISNLEPGLYGYVQLSTGQPSGSFMVIDKDFNPAEYPPNTDPEGEQKGALKVTIAHELKHAIQIVQNGWFTDAGDWAEMDATLMEEVVYDDVNDYYYYISSFSTYFDRPSISIIPGTYWHITWALYFHEKFGADFWPSVWSRLEQNADAIFLDTIAEEILNRGETYERSLIENFMWHYASGSEKSTPFFGFEESSFYPNSVLEESFFELQTELTELESISRFSGRYYEFDLIDQPNSLLRLDYIPSSEDIQVGLVAYYDNSSIKTRIYSNPIAEELNSIETGLSWSGASRIGLIFFNSSSEVAQTIQFQVYDYVPIDIDSPQLSQNYPNPFNPNTTITVTLPFSQQAKLTVYDYLGREVKILADRVLNAGENPIQFDARNLASGIYFYRLETEEKVVTRTMTLVK